MVDEVRSRSFNSKEMSSLIWYVSLAMPKMQKDGGGGGQFCFISCFNDFLAHLVNTTLTNTGKYEIYFVQTVGGFERAHLLENKLLSLVFI